MTADSAYQAALRTAVALPADVTLTGITSQAVAALGPGARGYVQQAHAAGYRTGVTDMESVHATMTEARRVADWLAGFRESGFLPGGGLTADDQAAVSRVRDLIIRRMEIRGD